MCVNYGEAKVVDTTAKPYVDSPKLTRTGDELDL